MNVEVRCHACPATTVVTFGGKVHHVDQLHKRGWDNTRGVIACKAHAGRSVMPRHRAR